MYRALQLARLGRGFTSPNPMVGAVIVADGRIIGEGYHRRIGGPHAEVWAVRSIREADLHLIPRATIYVTLEPCSHYGKTPPCAKMLIDTGFRQVVVGAGDPNPKVSGRGISMLRQAGIEVMTGVLEEECRSLNRPFMTAQTLNRPYILLKWAQSADGFLDSDRSGSSSPTKFSTPLSSQAMHTLRADFDAILVGSETVLADNPSLNVRLIARRSPRPVVIDRRRRIPSASHLLSNPNLIYISSRSRSDLQPSATQIMVDADTPLNQVIARLHSLGISSIMVEGGANIIQSFIESDLWDDARIEVAPFSLGKNGRNKVKIPSGELSVNLSFPPNVIINVKNACPATD